MSIAFHSCISSLRTLIILSCRDSIDIQWARSKKSQICAIQVYDKEDNNIRCHKEVVQRVEATAADEQSTVNEEYIEVSVTFNFQSTYISYLTGLDILIMCLT